MPISQPPSPAAPALPQAGRPARKLSYHELKALNSRPHNPDAPALDCTAPEGDQPSAVEYRRQIARLNSQRADHENAIISGQAARAYFARHPDRTA